MQRLVSVGICFVVISVVEGARQNYQTINKRLVENNDINQYANEGSLSNDPDLNDSNEIGESAGGEHASALLETIPGEPERDYPTYKTIPKTSFSCKGRVNWGYYADVDTECQVFHVCESAYSKISFLCPVGSAFNQRHLVCDWWYNFDCHDEISLTSLYDDYDLGREPDASDGGHRQDERDNRSLSTTSRGQRTLAKRRGGDYYEDDDYENFHDGDGLYDLNLVSSGGNV